MISEIINSLFLTYLASEYLIAEELSPGQQQQRRNNNAVESSRLLFKNIIVQKRTIPLAAIVFIINIVDHYLIAIIGVYNTTIKNIFERFLHLPKVIFAAIAYICGLYIDIKYNHKIIIQIYPTFLTKVFKAFCKVLPAYPFLAVFISFIFMFVINIFEALHLPLDLLNGPIYYGTLYGPFAYVYVYVKKEVSYNATSLPA